MFKWFALYSRWAPLTHYSSHTPYYFLHPEVIFLSSSCYAGSNFFWCPFKSEIQRVTSLSVPLKNLSEGSKFWLAFFLKTKSEPPIGQPVILRSGGGVRIKNGTSPSTNLYYTATLTLLLTFASQKSFGLYSIR